jgi:hypothetical protein
MAAAEHQQLKNSKEPFFVIGNIYKVTLNKTITKNPPFNFYTEPTYTGILESLPAVEQTSHASIGKPNILKIITELDDLKVLPTLYGARTGATLRLNVNGTTHLFYLFKNPELDDNELVVNIEKMQTGGGIKRKTKRKINKKKNKKKNKSKRYNKK